MTGTVVGVVVAVLVGWPSRRIRRLRRHPTAPTGTAADEARPDVPLALDLLAAALSSGVSAGAALQSVGSALAGPLGAELLRVGRALQLGASPDAAWRAGGRADVQRPARGRSAFGGVRARRQPEQVGGWRAGLPDDDVGQAVRTIRRYLDLSLTAGFGAGVVLRSGADAERRRMRRSREARAARLGVRLVLPLGVCVLPAFVALAVVPIVYALSQNLLR